MDTDQLEKLVKLRRLQKRQREQREETPSSETSPLERSPLETSVSSYVFQPLAIGESITSPAGERYVLTEELRIIEGEQRYTYRALCNEKEKVVKIIHAPHSSSALKEVEKLTQLYARINPALQREETAFALNSFQYVVLGDYLAGENMEHHLATHNPYSEAQTIDFLIEMLTGDVGKLHATKHEGNPLVHGDIKPSNILRTSECKHALIDFGTLRHTNASVTVTLSNLATTLCYQRGSFAKHSIQKDYGGLALVAYSLLTGKDPIGMVNIDVEEEKEIDTRKIKALPVNKRMQDILLKMLGYNGKYKDDTEIVKALSKVKEGLEEERKQELSVGGFNETNEIIGCVVAATATIITLVYLGLQANKKFYVEAFDTQQSCSVQIGDTMYTDKNCDGIAEESFGNNLKGVQGTVKDFWTGKHPEFTTEHTSDLDKKAEPTGFYRDEEGKEHLRNSYGHWIFNSETELFQEVQQPLTIHEHDEILRQAEKLKQTTSKK